MPSPSDPASSDTFEVAIKAASPSELFARFRPRFIRTLNSVHQNYRPVDPTMHETIADDSY